jgi:glycosyltransferase involved in cell wall biosynthesis
VFNAWLAESLAAKHQVTVLTSAQGPFELQEDCNGVRVIRVPVYFRNRLQSSNIGSMMLYLLNGLRYGRKLVSGESFDIINTHFVLPTGPLGYYLAKRAAIPNVLTLHGGDLYDPSKRSSPHRHLAFRAVVRHLMSAADAVVTGSRNTSDNISAYFDQTLSSTLIPLGITTPALPNRDRVALGWKEEDFVMITLCRLVARKAVDRLLELLASAGDECIRLVIIGDGPEKKNLMQRADTLGISPQVEFTGQITDQRKYSLLRGADIFASTSRHEGFGLMLIEAMTAGLPIVCYDHGGQTDFLIDGENAFLVPLNDEATFLQRIRTLQGEPQLRAQMGERCKEHAERYDISYCAARYESLFKDLCSDPASSNDQAE